jgi:hypothetical protein
MDEDMNSIDSLYSPLTLSGDISNIDTGFAGTSPGTGSVTGSVSTNTSGTDQSTSVSGFQSVLTGLTSLFSSGVQAYNAVAQATGLPLANGSSTTKPAPAAVQAPVVFAGLTQNQLLMIGGGLALVAILFFMKRK